MTSYHPELLCSNQFGQIILQGMEEVLGGSSLRDVLERSGGAARFDLAAGIPFASIGRIQAALEDLYGQRAGSGLALRSGRAAFHYGLRLLDGLVKLTTPTYRLLPPRQKLPAGAQVLVETFNGLCDGQARLSEDGMSYQWIVERCPVCWGRHSDAPVCHLQVGFLQEYLAWASGGKHYHVTESACAAAGAPACVFTIAKQALD